MDANREEVLKWCIDNKVDFCKPLFPPPEGWIWFDNKPPCKHKSLSAIFTNTVDEDIDPIDVLFRLAANTNKEN